MIADYAKILTYLTTVENQLNGLTIFLFDAGKEQNTSTDKGKEEGGEDTQDINGSGDTSKDEVASSENTTSDKEADTVADKLTELTVKENGDSSKDSEDKAVENKTDSEKKS